MLVGVALLNPFVWCCIGLTILVLSTIVMVVFQEGIHKWCEITINSPNTLPIIKSFSQLIEGLLDLFSVMLCISLSDVVPTVEMPLQPNIKISPLTMPIKNPFYFLLYSVSSWFLGYRKKPIKIEDSKPQTINTLNTVRDCMKSLATSAASNIFEKSRKVFDRISRLSLLKIFIFTSPRQSISENHGFVNGFNAIVQHLIKRVVIARDTAKRDGSLKPRPKNTSCTR